MSRISWQICVNLVCQLSGRDIVWWILVRAQFLLFKFRLLTSQDSHAHSLSHGNPITPLTPFVLLPPYDLHIKTNTDKNGTLSTRFWYSRVVQRQQQQTSVTTDIKTLGILNRGDLWRLPPHLQEPSQAGASSGRNPPDDKSNA